MSKDDSYFLKGIAIILLLFHHNPFDTLFGDVLQSGARVCVWIFIFITTYGFSLQFKEKYEKKPIYFILKRIVILYSLMWFFYLFNLVTEIILNPKGIIKYFSISVFNLPIDMLNVPNLFGKIEIASYWYVNCVIIIIALFPILYFLAKKTSWFSIPILILLTQLCPHKMSFIHGGQLNYYLLIVMLGILFAQRNVFEKLSKFKHKLSWLVIITGLILIAPLLILRSMFMPQLESKWYFSIGPFSTAITIIIVLMVYLCRTDGIISKAVKKLGEHSGNIYFSQGFFFNILVDGLRINNEFLSFAACLTYTLAISILVELIKKQTNYNYHVRNLFNRKEKNKIFHPTIKVPEY